MVSSSTSPFIDNSINFEWELYFTDEENNSFNSDQVPLLELSRSASPTPLETVLKIVATNSSIKSHSLEARIQAVTLLEIGLPVNQITDFTNIKKSRIYSLQTEALK
jgi:hypothetical protein